MRDSTRRRREMTSHSASFQAACRRVNRAIYRLSSALVSGRVTARNRVAKDVATNHRHSTATSGFPSWTAIDPVDPRPLAEVGCGESMVFGWMDRMDRMDDSLDLPPATVTDRARQ